MAANRDEFYARPTKAAHFWEDEPNILAGRDLEAGGTWMGVTKAGRFTAITNYRDPSIHKDNAPSRGHLTTNFLKSNVAPGEYLEELSKYGTNYYGFNLLVGTPDELWYYSNISGEPEKLEPGLYGLSNAFLDTSWPKLDQAKSQFSMALNGSLKQEELFELLTDQSKPRDEKLPETGIPLEWERAISSVFIKTEGYGTCCSTILKIGTGKMEFAEKTYEVGDRKTGLREFAIELY